MDAPAHVTGTHIWSPDAQRPMPVTELHLDFHGAVGDRHHGLTLRTGARQQQWYPKGTEIHNNRQVSIVDEAELARIATNLGIDHLAAGVIADNLCTSGIPQLTGLPLMTRLAFASGAVVVLGGENSPCVIAGRLVEQAYGCPAHAFPKAAMGLRGVTGWVERPGIVRAGDEISVWLP